MQSDDIFIVLLGAAGIVVVGALIYFVVDLIGAETFSLRKDEWKCTSSHTEFTFIPQVVDKTTTLIPVMSTICDQWTRK